MVVRLHCSQHLNDGSRQHAGFVLGLAIDAAMKYQEGSSHPDPIHVTAHFMRSASVGPYEVHIRILKVGKGFKNLSVAFVQKHLMLPRTKVASLIEPALPPVDPTSRAIRRMHPRKYVLNPVYPASLASGGLSA